jgi:hypothetical protein
MTLGRQIGAASKTQVVVITADPALAEMVRATFGTAPSANLRAGATRLRKTD